MANVKNESGSKGGSMFSGIVIALCILTGYIVWKFIMGAGSNFEGGVNPGNSLPGNYMGMLYKGGPIIPLLMGLLWMVIVYANERVMVISKAAGKGNLDQFMNRIQRNIADGNMGEAIEVCDKQKGSVANAIKAALVKYQDVKKEGFNSEEAAEMIHKEIEEATALEMPMLEKNMTILSTLVSLGTLAGSVSYTHLDVYKRQMYNKGEFRKMKLNKDEIIKTSTKLIFKPK